MAADRGLVREPKQERSRASFERALDATVSLLVERRSDGFTIAEVAARSGVSTGSIYARVASKDDLIRVTHHREMARLSGRTRQAFADLATPGAPLPQVVSRAVTTMADLLADRAPMMAPFMAISHHDAVIGAAGRAAHTEMVCAFTDLVLTAGPAITHADPARAAAWCCTVVYSVLARKLGLGSDPSAEPAYPMDVIVADLTAMVTAYLAHPAG